MSLAARHWRWMVVTMMPLVLGLHHITDVMHIQMLERLDHISYGGRLRATMPHERDESIVIVGIDEKNLSRVAQWPLERNKRAGLAPDLFGRQQVTALGLDVVSAELDNN